MFRIHTSPAKMNLVIELLQKNKPLFNVAGLCKLITFTEQCGKVSLATSSIVLVQCDLFLGALGEFCLTLGLKLPDFYS